MPKKPEAPVYPQPGLQENESRWQCATCKGYLAFSLPIDMRAMGEMLKNFSKAHERCAPGPDAPMAPPAAQPHTPQRRAGLAPQPPQPAVGMSYDPDGPTAKALVRREVLLSLQRTTTPAERRELIRLEGQLVAAGVLSYSATF